MHNTRQTVSINTRRIFTCVAILVGLGQYALPIAAMGKDKDTEMKAVVSNAVLAIATKSLSIKPLDSQNFEKVFRARLYTAEIGFNQGGSIFGTFVENEGKVFPLKDEQGGRNQDLAALLRSDFKIESEQSILDLREALLVVEGITEPEPDLPLYGLFERNWTIITGSFFDDYSGYVIHIGPRAGKIREIEYMVKIPRDALGRP